MSTAKGQGAGACDIERLLDTAHFYVSHSGGKDSLATYATVCEQVPSDRITVIHANLGEVEWDGIIEHIEANIEHPLNVVSAIFKDGSPKDFLGMVRRRHQKYPAKPCWPSSSYLRWIEGQSTRLWPSGGVRCGIEN